MKDVLEKSYKKTVKFSMKIVIFCIIFIALYTVAQTFLSYKVGMELSPTLTTCVYAFFGTELAACAVIKIFDTMKKKDSSDEYIPDEL